MNDNGRFHTYGRPFDENPRFYQTDVLTGKALSVIRSRAGRQPFFLSINFLAPHYEDRRIQRRTGQMVRPAPRHRGAYASAPLPRTASFNERDMRDKPRFLQRRTPQLTPADIARLTRDARSRRAALLAVDDAVDRIVTALRQRGQLDNTYILFTSDNGYMQGEHRVRSGKMLPYEPSAQVPLLIRGPGLPAGRVSSELVANTDLAPTLLDIAGAKAGKTVDGRSLLPFARHPNWRTRRAILHETGGSKYVSRRDQDEARNSSRSLQAGDDLPRRSHPRLALRALPRRREGALRPEERSPRDAVPTPRSRLPADPPRACRGTEATRALPRRSMPAAHTPHPEAAVMDMRRALIAGATALAVATAGSGSPAEATTTSCGR